MSLCPKFDQSSSYKGSFNFGTWSARKFQNWNFFMMVFFLKYIYFTDYAITVDSIFPLLPPLPSIHLPSYNAPLSSLASPFPILFLTFSCIYCTYQLCFLISTLFPPFSSSPSQPITIQMIFISMIWFLFLLFA